MTFKLKKMLLSFLKNILTLGIDPIPRGMLPTYIKRIQNTFRPRTTICETHKVLSCVVFEPTTQREISII